MVLPDGGTTLGERLDEVDRWDRGPRMRGDEEAGEFADAPLGALRSLLSDTWIAAV
jgi:hypothetical protein